MGGSVRREPFRWQALTLSAATLWACTSGSDTGATDVGSAVSSSASAASAGGAGATGSTAPASSSGAGGERNPGTPCEEACMMLDATCGFGPICSQVDFLDCSNPEADCAGGCVLAADCATIATLAGENPDRTLANCIQGCLGPVVCNWCIETWYCSAEFDACKAVPACDAFMACADQCTDWDCIEVCLAANPSPETDAIADCVLAECAGTCELPMPGRGGAGGAP